MKKKSALQPYQTRGFIKTGIILMLAAALIVGILSYRGLFTLRWGMSECLQWQSLSLCDRFIIDNQQFSRLNEIVLEFSQKIESGAIPPWRGFTVLRAFYNGPVMLSMLHSSLISRFHLLDVPEDADLQKYEQTSRQFFSGLQSGQINESDWEPIRKLLIENKICETPTSIGLTIPEQIETFKKNAGFNTLSACIAKMETVNQSIATASSSTPLDPVSELQKVINGVQ